MILEIAAKMHPDQFQPEKIIAAGPSAKVYRGVETLTGRKVLIKALMQDNETAYRIDQERLQQLAPSLMQLRHPQIAGLITLLPTEDDFALVSEFMPGMNGRAFDAERRPSPSDVRALAVQLMHALLVGEHLRLPHGDPKPSNLIISDHPSGGLFLQVQDWGLSLTRQSQPPETLWFRAPELHAGGMPTMKSDLFTAAGSLFCIATNSAPAKGTTVEEIMRDWQAFNASHVMNHLRPDLDQPLRDWLAWLLNLVPEQRPQSVAQALDVLMHSMHTGYTYLPQQAPVMAPGTQTTPLVSAAPKPRPILPKAAPAPAAATLTPAAAVKKAPRSRVVIAVMLNLAALTVLGFFVWPIVRDSMPKMEVSSAISTNTTTAIAAPLGTAENAQPAAPVPATPEAKVR